MGSPVGRRGRDRTWCNRRGAPTNHLSPILAGVIPWKRLDSAPTPDGDDSLHLFRRGDEYCIRIGWREVMNSRRHASEDALADLACTRVGNRGAPRVLIGGLGMGFTLAAAARRLPASAELVVAELVGAVVAWNRGALGEVAGRPLEDPRVRVCEQDVAALLREPGTFDAVLLDVDNSPDSLIQSRNAWLYTRAGLATTRDALRPGGVLSVWSAAEDAAFTRRLRKAGFDVELHMVREHAGKGARHTVWVAQRAEPSARRSPGPSPGSA